MEGLRSVEREMLGATGAIGKEALVGKMWAGKECGPDDQPQKAAK